MSAERPSLPKLHPRYFIEARAENEIQKEFWRIVDAHDLTFGEIFRILSGLLMSVSKNMVRAERNPDGDTEEAPDGDTEEAPDEGPEGDAPNGLKADG